MFLLDVIAEPNLPQKSESFIDALSGFELAGVGIAVAIVVILLLVIIKKR